MQRNRLAAALLGLGLLAIVAGSVPSAIAIGLFLRGDGQWRDVTPADAAGPVPEGTAVWLRGMRDPNHPLRLADGRVLYPTDEPTVMVDCADTACEGTLQGRLEDLDVEGPLPTDWPDGLGRRVRVIVVGGIGDAARDRATFVATLGLSMLTAGLLTTVVAVILWLRRRRLP